jgi:hypothetical protein
MRLAKRASIAEGVPFRGRKRPSGPRGGVVFEEDEDEMVPAKKEEVSTNELYVSDGKQAGREKSNLTSST